MTGIGESIERREDPTLLTGQAEFTDDLTAEGTVFAAVLRSPYAHASIEHIDKSRLENHPGVVGVFTGEDLLESGYDGVLSPVEGIPDLDDHPGKIIHGLTVPPRRILATDTVRYQGEPVAVVVAEDRYTAKDALDLVEVDYRRQEGVVDPQESLEDNAVRIHEEATGNVAFDWTIGDEAAIDSIFETGTTVTVEIDHQRLIPNPMEPRAAIAEHDPATDRLTLWTGTQTPHLFRTAIAETFGIPEGKVRVISPTLGGGFGSRSKPYPAELITAWCAILLNRPVKWQATRSETYLSSIHGRGQFTRGELNVGDEGRIRGFRVQSIADMGAYVSQAAALIHTFPFAGTLSGQYNIPEIYCRVKGAFTTTTPVDSYRGTSRPQATLLLERLIDRAADHLGITPVKIRRQNFIGPEAFPYETATAVTYDSGNYEATFDRALELINYAELRDLQADRDNEETKLGIGISCFVDEGGDPRIESGRVRVLPSGEVVVFTGTDEHGQGHYTTFSQIVAAELGVPTGTVEIKDGDTDLLATGTGTFGSRSAVIGGSVLVECAKRVNEKARKIAAHHLEVTAEDIDVSDGIYHVMGAPDRGLGFETVVELAYDPRSLPDGMDAGLEAELITTMNPTYSHGTHVAVVELATETGDVEIIDYVAVDDCGNQINPMVVEGQVHGGVAQGVGQALSEGAVYDETGTLISGSLQDYAVPKAPQLPDFQCDFTETPSPNNPLGIKGIGESGTIGAPAAVVNAVMDALAPVRPERVTLPLTAERVWKYANSNSN